MTNLIVSLLMIVDCGYALWHRDAEDFAFFWIMLGVNGWFAYDRLWLDRKRR